MTGAPASDASWTSVGRGLAVRSREETWDTPESMALVCWKWEDHLGFPAKDTTLDADKQPTARDDPPKFSTQPLLPWLCAKLVITGIYCTRLPTHKSTYGTDRV